MLEKKPLKSVTAKKTQSKTEPAPKYSQWYLYGCIGLGVLCLILLFLTVSNMNKLSQVTGQAQAMYKKIKENETPKFDEVNDFLTDQCNSNGVYCVDSVTKDPSLELLKFLVNFREQPNYKYKLFFEVSAGKTSGTIPFKLDCNPEDSDFYVCQQVSSAKPTDVIRAFQKSYATFSPSVNYSFVLMVKPISELELPPQVKVTPNDNLVVEPIANLDQQKVVDNAKARATAKNTQAPAQSTIDELVKNQSEPPAPSMGEDMASRMTGTQ